VAEVEAAAYVVSPAKAIPIGHFPAFAGAVVTHEAKPALFVVALTVTPLSVNMTVLPEMAAAPVAVLRVAERVIVAPCAALVAPVSVSFVAIRTVRVAEVEAAAYVVSPARATPIGSEPWRTRRRAMRRPAWRPRVQTAG
jgi:hypothetical protein